MPSNGAEVGFDAGNPGEIPRPLSKKMGKHRNEPYSVVFGPPVPGDPTLAYTLAVSGSRRRGGWKNGGLGFWERSGNYGSGEVLVPTPRLQSFH